MTSDKEASQLESLRQGLNLILQTDGLPPRVEKIVRRMLSLIQDETKIPNYIAESIQKMIESRAPITPPAKAMQLVERVRQAAGRRRAPLGRPAGRGAPHKKEDAEPRLKEMADKLVEKVKKASQRRRTSTRGGY